MKERGKKKEVGKKRRKKISAESNLGPLTLRGKGRYAYIAKGNVLKELGRSLYLVGTGASFVVDHFTSKCLNVFTIKLLFSSSSPGGLDSKSQEASLRKNPDVVIATPGRLVDHLHNAPSFSLAAIEILVLDEADR